MMRLVGLLVAATFLYTAGAVAHEVRLDFVEGKVLNSRTGAPLRSARVEASSLVEICEISTGCLLVPYRDLGTTFTDANGFFEFPVELQPYEGVQVRGYCQVGESIRVGSAEVTPGHTGTVERQIFLDVGRRRVACDAATLLP